MICLAMAILAPQTALGQQHAIFKSLDRGLSWVKAGAISPGNPRINAFGAATEKIFAGTDAGIYASSDGGHTWQKTSVTARTVSFVASGGTVYAGTQTAGLLQSRDNGATWAPMGGLASKHIRSLLTAKGQLFAGTDSEGVMVSSDQGITWRAQNAGLPPLRQIFAMARVDGTIFAALYAKGLYAWSEADSRWFEAGQVKPLEIAATGGTLFVGHNPGGIYWSEKPKSSAWTKSTGDFAPGAPVWKLTSGDNFALAGVADGIFRSEDAGRTWSRTQRGLPPKSPAVSFLVLGHTVYASVAMTAGGQ
jgi:photosystem II stability/assembly factor-like uncharacterized protein